MKLFLMLLFIALTNPAFSQQDAKKTFERLKTLDGEWQGSMRTTPAVPEVDGTLTKVTFRVTSMGNLLMHEMTGAGRPDDPITTIYLDTGSLTLTHYCDAGNRPRMKATASPDGRQVEFDFVDVAGSTEYGYMRRAVFTMIDVDHHTEEWTFMMPGEKPMRARVELTRVTKAASPQRKAPVLHKHQ